MRWAPVFRVALGVVFIWASLDKIVHPAEFADVIVNYQLLPESLVNLAAVFLPWLELVCGLALVLDVLSLGAAAVASALLAVFTASLVLNLTRGIDVACGCFSVGAARSGPVIVDVLRDLALLGLGLTVFFGQWKRGGQSFK